MKIKDPGDYNDGETILSFNYDPVYEEMIVNHNNSTAVVSIEHAKEIIGFLSRFVDRSTPNGICKNLH